MYVQVAEVRACYDRRKRPLQRIAVEVHDVQFLELTKLCWHRPSQQRVGEISIPCDPSGWRHDARCQQAGDHYKCSTLATVVERERETHMLLSAVNRPIDGGMVPLSNVPLKAL